MDNEPELIEGLTEGRMVHYVLGNDSKHAGEHRPAVIVKVWNKYQPGTSNLCVFVDGTNDFEEHLKNANDRFVPNMTQWETSVNYSEGKEPNTWHWIEKA